MEFKKDTLMKAYRAMYMSRQYENNVNEMFRAKKCSEKPLSGVGQEATGVGMTILLRDEDCVAPTLRSKGAFFGKGMTPEEGFMQLFRRAGSQSGGVWTSHHIGVPEKGILLSSAIVASSLSVATGVALAAKLRKEDRVVVAFIGDGSTSRADFHTAINFAAVQDLPIVFVCENNLYALSTHISEQMKNPNVADRAVGYGIPGEIVDGQDCVKVMEAAEKAIDRARRGEGPSLIECKTYRFRGHTESHDPDDGRPAEELAKYRSRCPIRLMEEYLLENHVANEAELKAVRDGVDAEIVQAIARSEAAPKADITDFESLVYAQ